MYITSKVKRYLVDIKEKVLLNFVSDRPAFEPKYRWHFCKVYVINQLKYIIIFLFERSTPFDWMQGSTFNRTLYGHSRPLKDVFSQERVVIIRYFIVKPTIQCFPRVLVC